MTRITSVICVVAQFALLGGGRAADYKLPETVARAWESLEAALPATSYEIYSPAHWDSGDVIRSRAWEAGRSLLVALHGFDAEYAALDHPAWVVASERLFVVDAEVSRGRQYGNFVLKAQVFEMVVSSARDRLLDAPMSDSGLGHVCGVLDGLRRHAMSLSAAANLVPVEYGDPPFDDSVLTASPSMADDLEKAKRFEGKPEHDKYLLIGPGNPALREWEQHKQARSLLDYYDAPAPWVLGVAVGSVYYRSIRVCALYAYTLADKGGGFREWDELPGDYVPRGLPDEWRKERLGVRKDGKVSTLTLERITTRLSGATRLP